MKTQIICLKTKLEFENEEDKDALISTLELARQAFNYCSEQRFKLSRNNIVELHAKCYKHIRKEIGLKSAFAVQSERACLSAYTSIKSNGHKIDESIFKKRLSMSLNKTMVSRHEDKFHIATQGKRVKVKLKTYDRLNKYLDNHKFGDPTIFVKDNEVFIALPFKVEVSSPTSGMALGVDLGIRRLATTSEGNIYIDRKFNKEKRRLRYLKRVLNSKKAKSNSAKRKLKRIRFKEHNKNVNLIHHLANKIVDTKANYIILEDLNVKKMKSKKYKRQNKNKISQISFSQLNFFITYKAALLNKEVVCVNPSFTSQISCITNKKDGERKGCRYYCKSGQVLDSDVNAAINIARRSKLPISQGNPLDGQAIVNLPIVK